MVKEIFEKIYNETNNKKEFIKICNLRHQIKKSSAERRWYDLYKKLGKQNFKQKYSEEQKSEPNHLKKLMIEDFKKMKIKINKDFLKKWKFNELEINWLEDNNYFD
jgi:hypothetical protein